MSTESRRGFDPLEQGAKRADDGVVPFAEQGGQDVLADLVPPQVIAAVTPRYGGGVEVDPMIVVAAYDVVSAFTDTPSFELEASFQPVEVDPTSSFEIDCRVCHSHLLLRSPSRLFAYSWHASKNTRRTAECRNQSISLTPIALVQGGQSRPVQLSAAVIVAITLSATGLGLVVLDRLFSRQPRGPVIAIPTPERSPATTVRARSS